MIMIKESFAIFAKSFSKKINEFEGKKFTALFEGFGEIKKKMSEKVKKNNPSILA